MGNAYIPGTLGFTASDAGEIRGPSGELKNVYKNLDGYCTASVKLVDGSWRTFGVHRLVALAHIPDDRDKAVLEVNHIDKDLNNNTVSN